MQITKRNGRTEPFQLAKLRRVAGEAAAGLDGTDVEAVLVDVEVGLYDGMPTRELRALLLDAALTHVADDPAHSRLAARLLLFDLYKQALGKASFRDLDAAHRTQFPRYVSRGVQLGLLSPLLLERFDLDTLAGALCPARDLAFRFNGLFALQERYLVRDLADGIALEVPQFLWMRVAMGVAIEEDDPTGRAHAFYEAMSTFRYIPSTPTLFNAGTPTSQLSSCFLIEAEDSMDAIGKVLCDIMQLAKYAGGIGASITKLRATGSVIHSINGRSSGPIPFVKMMDAVIAGVDQGGRRRGTLAVYMEPWHYDVERFLDLKQRTGDDSQRAHSLNTVLFLNDEFLRRVEDDQPWFLFDPKETPDLPELSGRAFSDRYRHYAEEARAGRLRTFRTLRARELFHRMLKSLVETSHPWLTFKDPGNLRCPVAHAGPVHSSNLCTEIFLPADADHVAVCNLASVVLPTHLGDAGLDWGALAASVRLAVRHLDDVIGANFYAIPEAARANRATRPVGLGVMGWADLLERLGIPFEADEAADLLDTLIEFVSWHAVDASADLARERGSFPAFEGSDWARGLVPVDTLAHLDADRGSPVDVPRAERMDWGLLRTKVAGGMRNGTVMAIAPTATISLIAGTSQSIEPPFALVYARNNIAGKFLEMNENLVGRLKTLGLWESVAEEMLLSRGDLSRVPGIPPEVKALFRTAYQIPPNALVRQAAVVQKWVDQGVSRNIYLTRRDPEALTAVYLGAWRAGLKSTYYAFTRPSMRAEATFAYDERRPTAHLAEGSSPAPCSSEVCEACQ
ncbi:MAG: ribonucleoside-diphosphate reductase subunit alpha [Actinomycetota bacterium]